MNRLKNVLLMTGAFFVVLLEIAMASPIATSISAIIIALWIFI